MYAEDARKQQEGVPDGKDHPYPAHYRNGERLPLTTPGSDNGSGYGREWLHYPMTPGKKTTWTRQSGVPRGGVRSVYTAGNKEKFDVIYHNKKEGKSAKGHGVFQMAKYRPGGQRPSKH